MDQFSHVTRLRVWDWHRKRARLTEAAFSRAMFVVKSWHRAALLLIALIALAGFLAWKCERDAKVNFLPRHHGAEWIVFPATPDANLHPLVSLDAAFRREFTLPVKPARAQLRLRAARNATLKINGVDVDLALPRNWKDEAQSNVAPFLREGVNVIEVKVTNDHAPPALWLLLSADEFQLASGADWDVSFTGSSVRRAALADAARLPGAGNAVAESMTTANAFAASWPWLLLFAIVAAAGALAFRRWPSRTIVCAVIAALWLALFWNNSVRLPFRVGFDSELHLNYVRFIQEHKALPLPRVGLEMYQPPLYYLISAAALSAARLMTQDQLSIFVLRAVTWLFALAHLAIVFLTLRLVFPNQRRAQAVGMIVAAFLPMQIYMSHYVTNETAAATFIAAGIYLTLRLLKTRKVSLGQFCFMGTVVGMAMLTKATAMALLPFAILAGAVTLLRQRAPALIWLRNFGVLLLVCFAVSGWHYIRTGPRSDSPFLGVAGAFSWWQDPGYHTATDYFRFGQSLVRPLFSGFGRFWDGIYSTLWGDGLCGGVSVMDFRPPWNYSLVLAGYLLAVAPTLLIAVGFAVCLIRYLRRGLRAELLLIGFAGAMMLALIVMSITVASYGQIKAFFGLSALSAIAFLAANGWVVLGGRSKIVQIALTGVLLLWAINSYASHCILPSTAKLYAALRLSNDGKIDSAMTAAHAAIEANPSNALARRVMASLFVQAGHPEEALDEARHAVELAPEDSNAHAQLALILFNKGDATAAIEQARKAVTLGPENQTAQGILLAVLFGSHRIDETIAAARDALAVAPYRKEFHQILATALEHTGESAGMSEQSNYAKLLDSTARP
jgi:tetratricopeptide (TPR) repeat protein